MEGGEGRKGKKKKKASTLTQTKGEKKDGTEFYDYYCLFPTHLLFLLLGSQTSPLCSYRGTVKNIYMPSRSITIMFSSAHLSADSDTDTDTESTSPTPTPSTSNSRSESHSRLRKPLPEVMKLRIPTIFSARKIHATIPSQKPSFSRENQGRTDKPTIKHSSNIITFDELQNLACNPKSNLPIIIIQDENGRVVPQEEPAPRSPIALADVTYKDSWQGNRLNKSHHPYPHGASENVRPRTASPPPPKHRFVHADVRYNFDDIAGAVPKMTSEREARSNVAARKAIKNQKIVTAIFAEEIRNDSKTVSARKTTRGSGSGVRVGRTW